MKHVVYIELCLGFYVYYVYYVYYFMSILCSMSIIAPGAIGGGSVKQGKERSPVLISPRCYWGQL